ncbi:ABC transporter ATP-binding protein [Clostridium vincentii]|uniref:Aliphatic sulfonates import ATP-binding protein SsuB n=1 Tax=Clostridium vincentii TaxID=52704 RepID=A0A2T0BDI7_9CLOT|nr:ABC transporter ATP-binding protein [Clostridium vincentii]PRR81915.1 Aliphatic sulfonates import ATP-binding protein SsuB [Clostridium vincentii]
MKIRINNLCKSFDGRFVFNKFNLQLDSENINCIIGESGGGKSTLLNILSGLLKADSGDIIGIKEGDISYIFQEDRLVNWLTVKENMELFIYDYYKKEDVDRKLKEIFKLLHIEDLENKYPEKLSGGMKQRVNIARALLKPSKLILMDEPFKSLDYKTKYSIMAELKIIFKNENRMVIFVTHDVDEAIYMEGNIYILGGKPFDIKGIFTNNLLKFKEEIIKLI